MDTQSSRLDIPVFAIAAGLGWLFVLSTAAFLIFARVCDAAIMQLRVTLRLGIAENEIWGTSDRVFGSPHLPVPIPQQSAVMTTQRFQKTCVGRPPDGERAGARSPHGAAGRG
jgi:hypothetical protein